MITKSQAEAHRGDFHHVTERNRDGTPLRARPNGKCKTWKTRPGEFQLPVKYGLKTHFYITHTSASQWCTSAAEALQQTGAQVMNGMDIRTKEGMAAAVEWQRDLIASLNDGGYWVVPADLATYCIDKQTKTFTLLSGRPSESIARVCREAGYNVVYPEV